MSKFTESVHHYCEGLPVSVGCRGPECEHAENDYDPDNHQCETHFSWLSCDSCGSSLGGDRFPAFLLPHDAEPIALDICVDCAMYHANGDEPETWVEA